MLARPHSSSPVRVICQRRASCSLRLFATFCGLVLALVFALVAPATAHADTYSLPRVNIQAQVMENGVFSQ